MDQSVRVVVAALLLTLLVMVLAPRARAAGGIRVLGEPKVENQFPDALQFSLEAESDAEIQDIRLRYRFMPDNTGSTARAEFERGAKVKAQYALRSGSNRLYIPPGKTIRYSWELADAAGNRLTTEERETAFTDIRFKWQTAKDGLIEVNFYRGNMRDAEVMAQVARETVEKAAKLTGAVIDFPVKIWAYASRVDFQIALAHGSVTSDPGVLGQAHSPDTFIMVVDRLSSPTAFDTARHELTHLVTADALQGGPFKDLYPSWLNEGTSVFLQASPNDVGYIDELEKAIKEDKVFPVKSLTSGNRVSDVGLFYGQSYSVVKYLVDTFGEAKFAQMIQTFRTSGDLNATFRTVYGTDLDGLNRQWRKSVGLPEEQKTPPSAAGLEPKAGTDGGPSTGVLAAAGAAMTVLAGAAVAGGVLLARIARRRAVDGDDEYDDEWEEDA